LKKVEEKENKIHPSSTFCHVWINFSLTSYHFCIEKSRIMTFLDKKIDFILDKKYFLGLIYSSYNNIKSLFSFSTKHQQIYFGKISWADCSQVKTSNNNQ